MPASKRLKAIPMRQEQRIIARIVGLIAIGSPYRPRVGPWLDGLRHLLQEGTREGNEGVAV
jgi:hypothetical protein